jgi:excisionase family DNA binding protein
MRASATPACTPGCHSPTMTSNETPPVYLGTRAAAAYLGLNHYTIREWLAAGKLPAYRLGTTKNARIRINRSDLDALLVPYVPTTQPAADAPPGPKA